jgi:hypothetical protein
LLTPSILDLQCILDISGLEGSLLGLYFTAIKSHCLIIGLRCHLDLLAMVINGLYLSWVDRISYLGILISKGIHFNVDLSDGRPNFFCSVNCILNGSHSMSDIAKQYLCETHCLPVIAYASESLLFACTQFHEIHNWWNFVYRKIFKYNKWESVN